MKNLLNSATTNPVATHERIENVMVADEQQIGSETALLSLPVIMTVPEMARYLRIGRNNAYDLVKEQGFPALRFGRQIRIPLNALNEWMASRAVSQ